jgi:hypothetical protein
MAAACDRYYKQLGKELGVDGVCGLCLYVCPGRKAGRKNGRKQNNF